MNHYVEHNVLYGIYISDSVQFFLSAASIPLDDANHNDNGLRSRAVLRLFVARLPSGYLPSLDAPSVPGCWVGLGCYVESLVGVWLGDDV